MSLRFSATKRRPRPHILRTAFSPAARVWPSSQRHFTLHYQLSSLVKPLPSPSFSISKHLLINDRHYESFSRMQSTASAESKRSTIPQNNNPNELDNNFVKTAAAAAAAVNASISNDALNAPSTNNKSFIAREKLPEAPLDPEGLPLSYDREAIEKYWKKSRGSLQRRWTEFLAVSVPFFTRLASLAISGGMDNISANTESLAKQAVQGAEKLGPTYVKMGQMLSSRPDVLPQEALSELSKLQDAVQTFDTSIAISIIESELGQRVDEVFEEISEEPVAAASLAQVYKATLKDTGEKVAIKVQRPNARSVVSKDLYVLRRAAQIYQRLMDRFAPQQNTNYIDLLDEWAIGFYTELDFKNEMKNQIFLKQQLQQYDHINDKMYIPNVYEQYCTRRMLVSEWVDCKKLTLCSDDEIRKLTRVGQEIFLIQLFQIGAFHADPHAGNLGRLNDGRLCILDFGLVATLKKDDIDRIVNSIIHLANKDYSSLVDDFIALDILPRTCDRATVMPLMDKALSPYVKGGGAKKYEAEIRKTYGMSEGTTMGGFSAMTRDAVTVFNDIPFSIPPYFALLARAIVTLEGLALQGDKDYALIMEAYPFVAKKLIRDDTPQLQKALQDVLYGGSNSNSETISISRLSALIIGAMGIVSKSKDNVFVDLDTVNDQVPMSDILKYVLSEEANSLRTILRNEIDNAFDVLLRQSLRKVIRTFAANVPTPSRIPLIGRLLPIPPTEDVPLPILIPGSASPLPKMMSVKQFTDVFAPALSREEEIYALALVDAANEVLGSSAAALVSGDALVQFDSMRSTFLDPLANILNQGIGRGTALNSFASSSNVEDMGRMVVNEVLPSEIIEAVEGLDNEERDSLVSECRGIMERAWSRCVERLQKQT